MLYTQQPNPERVHRAVDVANLRASLFSSLPLTLGAGRVAAMLGPRQLDRLLIKTVAQLLLLFSQQRVKHQGLLDVGLALGGNVTNLPPSVTHVR